jgi:hypothetical protein
MCDFPGHKPANASADARPVLFSVARYVQFTRPRWNKLTDRKPAFSLVMPAATSPQVGISQELTAVCMNCSETGEC